MDILAQLTTTLSDRYRIDREIGAGGMATVYLAEDLKHRRRVAIKVLHPELAAVIGAERFLAEIQLTASLQHPHILPLFDSGSALGLLYFVMPFVEGETLRARLERERQLPVADAVRIAGEVADALEYAHRRNVVHRDIKPENILLHDGRPLVADFGIALAVQHAGGSRLTQTGLSLGTPQYMAPEQAAGERTIDARADIYALAAVTYELLTGEPPFTGATTQAVIAKLLTATPASIVEQRRTVPAHVERAVLTSLEKLPADRHTSAAAFAAALNVPQATSFDHATSTTPASVRAPRFAWPKLLAPIGLLLALTGGYVVLHDRPAEDTPGVMMMSINPADDEEFLRGGNWFAVSPRGDRIAIVRVANGGSWELALRRLDRLETEPLVGTSGAVLPFWSPDGRKLGFFADRQLKLLDLETGAVRELCAAVEPRGASWGADDVILYTPDRGSPLHRTTARGGDCAPLGIAQPAHPGARPYFMEDGLHFIASTDQHTWLGKVGEDSLTLLRENSRALSVYAFDQYLLYAEDGLNAAKIDVRARRLGEGRRILQNVVRPGGSTAASVSRNGVLVTQGQGSGDRHLLRIARGGGARDSIGTAPGGAFAVSRDGKRLAGGGWNTWITDLVRGARVPISAQVDTTRQYLGTPLWSPLDTLIAFARAFGGRSINAYDTRTGRARVLFTPPSAARTITLTDWSADGRYIAFELGPGAGSAFSEPWVLDLTDGSARRMFDENADVGLMQFSPDGRFVAYHSTLDGKDQVYLRAFPAGLPVPVTTAGGRFPRWRADGRELFYIAPSSDLVAVAVAADGSLESRTPVVVMPASAVAGLQFAGYTASRDGREFILNAGRTSAVRFTFVHDWRMLLTQTERN